MGLNIIYNPTHYKDGKLFDVKISRYNSIEQQYSIKVYTLKNGILLGMFQGSRGDMPHLDFIIKFLEKGKKKKLRTPTHTHWIVDLLLKKEHNPIEVYEFVKYYRKLYDNLKPFETLQERNNYVPISPPLIEKIFPNLHDYGTYSLEYLAYLIELFSICEKRSSGAFMFRNLLQMMVDYCEEKNDYFQIISHTKRV